MNFKQQPFLAFLIPAILLFSAISLKAQDPYLLISRKVSNPNFQYHPSPEDWRDTSLYQLFTDRFFDGDPSNNNIRKSTSNVSWYNQNNSSAANARHLAQGGDWEGIKQKIPYLKNMGIKAIWISSVQRNEQGADKNYTPYHGYHPTDLWRVEPLFGTFQQLKDMIDTCHANGIYVILDVVPNHMADLLGLGGGKDDQYFPFGGGNLFWWNNNVKHAPPFDNPQYFHNNGRILNWDDYWQCINGAFVGTDDLKTSDPFVQSELIKAFKNLIDATDCDGFRVDAIKHVEFDFIRYWADEMRKHAASRGKNNFLIFGELFSFDDNAHAAFTKEEGYSFNSAMWFSMMQTMKNVFANESGTKELWDRLANLQVFGEGAKNAIAFPDNHDVDRICLYKGNNWVDTLRPAIGFLYTATPVPTILYGTEHGFNQGGVNNKGIHDGDYQREVMWNFGYQWGNAQGDKFNTPSPIVNLIKQINQAREQHLSLRRGNLIKRWDSNTKGIFAYTRQFGDEESLVVINTDWGTQNCTPAVAKPNGTQFTNVLNPSEKLTVTNGTLNVSIGKKDVKIFVAGSGLAITSVTHWPTAGNITFADDLWIDVATTPIGAAIEGTIVYSSNGGSTWQTKNFVANGQNTTSNLWHVNLGKFPGGTTIKYAVVFKNNQNQETWNNNNGNDYTATVNTGGPSITFHGNVQATSRFTPTITIEHNVGANALNLLMSNLISGKAYTIEKSTDLVTWSPHATVTPTAATHVQTLYSGFSMLNNPKEFYRVKVIDPFSTPLKAGNSVRITIDSQPKAAAKAANLVYSSDGGNTWQAVSMTNDNPDPAKDTWSYTFTSGFAAGTTLKYAIELIDTNNISVWNNNNNQDYTSNIVP